MLKESMIVSDMILDEILEEVFQQVKVDTGKDPIYAHPKTNYEHE